MTPSSPLERDLIRRHLSRMRIAGAVALMSIPAAAAAVFFLPPLRHSFFGPTTTTILAAAAALWIGLSANRDAHARLERVKRAYAVHGDLRRLLRDHLLVYLVVLIRLDLVALCGLVVAAWGNGSTIGLGFIALAGVMMVTTWPTEHKTWLLIERAQRLREP